MDNTAGLNPFQQVKNTLAELKNETSSDALSYALEAQLIAIDIIFISNTLLSSIDLLLQSLKSALERSCDINERETIRLKAAIMINSIVFFSESKLYYEENKWRDEGIELLQQGCDLLADSVIGLIGLVKIAPISKLDLAQKMLDALLVKKGRNGFLTSFIELFTRKDKHRKEFMSFMYSLVKKLSVYSYMFGNSLLLAELIERYKNVLIEMESSNSTPLPKAPKASTPPVLEQTTEPFLLTISFGITIVLFVITCLIAYNSGFNIAANIFCVLSVIGVIISVSLKGMDISIMRRNREKMSNYDREEKIKEDAYNLELSEYNNKIKAIEKYYDDIIQTFR